MRIKSTFIVSYIYLNILKSAKFLNPFINLILAENTKVGTFVAKMETINSRVSKNKYNILTSLLDVDEFNNEKTNYYFDAT